MRHWTKLKFVVSYLPQVAPRTNVTFSISAEVGKTFAEFWNKPKFLLCDRLDHIVGFLL